MASHVLSPEQEISDRISQEMSNSIGAQRVPGDCRRGALDNCHEATSQVSEREETWLVRREVLGVEASAQNRGRPARRERERHADRPQREE
jgi:hypothetical protein